MHVATDFNCCSRTAAAKFFAVFSNSLASVGSAFVNAGSGDCSYTTAALFVAWSDVVFEGDAFWFTHVLGHCKGEYFCFCPISRFEAITVAIGLVIAAAFSWFSIAEKN